MHHLQSVNQPGRSQEPRAPVPRRTTLDSEQLRRTMRCHQHECWSGPVPTCTTRSSPRRCTSRPARLSTTDSWPSSPNRPPVRHRAVPDGDQYRNNSSMYSSHQAALYGIGATPNRSSTTSQRSMTASRSTILSCGLSSSSVLLSDAPTTNSRVGLPPAHRRDAPDRVVRLGLTSTVRRQLQCRPGRPQSRRNQGANWIQPHRRQRRDGTIRL